MRIKDLSQNCKVIVEGEQIYVISTQVSSQNQWSWGDARPLESACFGYKQWTLETHSYFFTLPPIKPYIWPILCLEVDIMVDLGWIFTPPTLSTDHEQTQMHIISMNANLNLFIRDTYLQTVNLKLFKTKKR